MKYIIYEITPLDKSIVYSYVGSTKNFRNRKFQHKSICDNKNNTKKYNYPLYSFIRANGGWAAFEMNPIEEIEVETKLQARIREQFWKEDREKKQQILNAINPYSGLSKDEYQKKYKDENKQEIREKANEKHICMCGGKYTTTSKIQHLKTLKHQQFQTNMHLSNSINKY